MKLLVTAVLSGILCVSAFGQSNPSGDFSPDRPIISPGVAESGGFGTVGKRSAPQSRSVPRAPQGSFDINNMSYEQYSAVVDQLRLDGMRNAKIAAERAAAERRAAEYRALNSRNPLWLQNQRPTYVRPVRTPRPTNVRRDRESEWYAPQPAYDTGGFGEFNFSKAPFDRESAPRDLGIRTLEAPNQPEFERRTEEEFAAESAFESLSEFRQGLGERISNAFDELPSIDREDVDALFGAWGEYSDQVVIKGESLMDSLTTTLKGVSLEKAQEFQDWLIREGAAYDLDRKSYGELPPSQQRSIDTTVSAKNYEFLQGVEGRKNFIDKGLESLGLSVDENSSPDVQP